ncbi:MAG TPA: glutamyl-tRNA reductase [Anaerolineae bacterium]|nr:glutamyl-tRNA reductase [Anaerolineae bacterium]
MPILAFGINHKTAPVEIREKVSFPADGLSDALKQLTGHEVVNEAAILSTCNRTEIVCSVEEDQRDVLVDWFQRYHQLDRKDLEPYIYFHPDQFAVRHLLRVAAGLDSLILGEPQILGQMKQAYMAALEAGTVGSLLGRLFQHTFSVAKQVRTDTAIGSSPVSVAFAAVSLAKQIFSGLDKHSALLIGAGETVELAARHLHENGLGKMIIANRTVEKAHALAQEFGGYAIALSEIPTHLAEADIVISSTASQLPILGKGAVERALKVRRHRPILMVDIAVPRDIEPEAGDLDDVYLYTVDDLQEIIQEGLRSRQEAAHQAEEIIDNQVTHFMGWLQSLDAVATIRAYRDKAEALRDQEVAKARRLLARGTHPEEVCFLLARALTNKLIHTPSATLRQAGFEGRSDMLELARELFDLKDPHA